MLPMVSRLKRTDRIPKMKDFATCFSEHAVRVSDSSCSGGGAGTAAALAPAIQNAVSCLYRARLSTKREVLIGVNWSRTPAGPTASVSVGGGNPRPLIEKKGRESFVSDSAAAAAASAVDLYWDLSSAKFGSGPEPVSGFCVAVAIDAEVALVLGEASGDFVKELQRAEFSMVGRREQIVGRAVYATRARFRDGGREHEICIKCVGESELSVCVDRKRVVHVARLEYNFRGNQTIFVDGSPVDLMWDAHGWWLGPGPGPGPVKSGGCAVFLFRARTTLESRLWLEEMLDKEQLMEGFSLVIQAFKAPMRIAHW